MVALSRLAEAEVALMIDRGPPAGLSRPRSPENVQARHVEIVRLRRERLLLKQIAVAVGLKDHSSVLYHLSGECRCVSGWRNGRVEGLGPA